MQKNIRIIALCFTGLALGACGSGSQAASTGDTVQGTVSNGGSGNSTVPGIAVPDGHQAAQASHDSVDNAGAADTVTGQQGDSGELIAAGHLAFDHAGLIDADTLTRYALTETFADNKTFESGASVSATFDNQGCRATFAGAVRGTINNYTLDANLTYTPSNCTRSRKFTGSTDISAVFDANGRTVSVTENMNQTLQNGDVVKITSAVAGQPTYVLHATQRASAGNVTLSTAINEHRTRTASTGVVVYDLDISTDPNAAIEVINGFAADTNNAAASMGVKTRTIVSGATTVVHNLAHYTAKHTFANISRTVGACNCPQSGTLQEDVTYSDVSGASYSRLYTFNGCGTASVQVTASTDPNVLVGTTQAVWDSCD